MAVDTVDYSDVVDQLKDKTVSLRTRSGQGILFSNYLLHGADSYGNPDWRRFSIWANAIPASCDAVQYSANLDPEGNISSLNEHEYGLNASANKRMIDPCEHLPLTKSEFPASMNAMEA